MTQLVIIFGIDYTSPENNVINYTPHHEYTRTHTQSFIIMYSHSSKASMALSPHIYIKNYYDIKNNIFYIFKILIYLIVKFLNIENTFRFYKKRQFDKAF